jgi:hypothetical protein
MALSFPNRMRFYDTTRCAVGFWGHDGAMESSFFVAADSLKRLQPAMRFNEDSILATFDLNREVIQSAAAKAYARARKSSYELGTVDIHRSARKAATRWMAAAKLVTVLS